MVWLRYKEVGGGFFIKMSESAVNEKVVSITKMVQKQRQSFLLQIIQEHEVAIHRFLRVRLANHADREDIAQDVFAKLCRIENLPDKLSLGSEPTRAFLFTTATNLIRDWHRKENSRKRGSHEPLTDESSIDTSTAVEDRAEFMEKLALINKSIKGLSPTCRSVFEMSRFDGLSYKEISDEMNISVSMVEKHISRALVALRRALRHSDL